MQNQLVGGNESACFRQTCACLIQGLLKTGWTVFIKSTNSINFIGHCRYCSVFDLNLARCKTVFLTI